jgi:hypothetical protein
MSLPAGQLARYALVTFAPVGAVASALLWYAINPSVRWYAVHLENVSVTDPADSAAVGFTSRVSERAAIISADSSSRTGDAPTMADDLRLLTCTSCLL